MIVIENLENNIQKMKKYVDVKSDKLSEVMKFFYDDMIALEMSCFAKTEQIKIFEKAFERDIKYITYVSIFNRLSKERSITEMFHKNGEFNIESEVENTNTLSSENYTKIVLGNEDRKALKESLKNGSSFMKNLVNQGKKNIETKKEIIDEK